MSSEERVAQGVENRAEIVRSNVGNYESPTVENEVKFEIILAEVGFLARPTCKLQIRVGFSRTVLHPTACLVGSRAAPNLTNEDYLISQWKCRFMRLRLPKLTTATDELIKIQGVEPFVRMENLQCRI